MAENQKWTPKRLREWGAQEAHGDQSWDDYEFDLKFNGFKRDQVREIREGFMAERKKLVRG